MEAEVVANRKAEGQVDTCTHQVAGTIGVVPLDTTGVDAVEEVQCHMEVVPSL